MRKIKIKVSFLVLVLILSLGAEAFAAVVLRSFWKESYPMEDAILSGIEPNVLFFLDTSSSMTMSMKGELPTFVNDDDIMKEKLPSMRDARFRANLMAGCTYGTGTRPLSTGTAKQQAARINNRSLPLTPPFLGSEQSGWETNDDLSSLCRGYTRYGKDTNADNNIIGDPNCYYSPDPSKPYLLTFRDFAAATAAKPPTGFQDGKPAPANRTEELVPNDSKMYQMKLVLWRLLSPENAEMLSRIRLAVATNFFDYISAGTRGPLYRRPPYRTEEPEVKGRESGSVSYLGGIKFNASHNGKYMPIDFPHGTAPFVYTGIPGGDYGHAETVYAAVMTAYENNETRRRHAYRACLRVPFDCMYTQKDGIYSPTSSLVMFQELIDGVEQMDFSEGKADRFVNEELIAGGTTLLSTSFYGRNGLHASASNGTNLNVLRGQKAIDYALGEVNTRVFRKGIEGSYEGVMMRRFLNSEKLMAGSALGSAIDFFSPFHTLPFTEKTREGGPDDTRGYFPITGSCQPGWLVVFTGGNEKVVPERNPVDSLLDLYKNSQSMRGRRWNGSKWVERVYEMDNPIRTIFVGLVSTEGMENDGDPYSDDLPTDSDAKRLRKAIRKMAHAGQPCYDSNGTLTPNKDVNPYFADNASSLLNALQSILQSIRAERFASGAPVILPDDDGGESNTLFTASYQVHSLKQWEGSLHRFYIPDDPSEDISLIWKAESQMAERAAANTRAVYTTNQRAEVQDASVVNIGEMRDVTLASLTGTPLEDAPRFRTWLLQYPDEAGVMGDTEHSGITIVGDAALEGIASRDKRIYIHTNRGILHALDFNTGAESWAFIPPNVFQHRIKDQKFLLGTTWYEGNVGASILSRPLALLDGMLSASDVIVGNTPKTLLLGAMGWGGNGFYAMDATQSGNRPKFLWAIDNARYAESESPLIDGVKRWGASASGGRGDYDYSDLGLTIAAPEIRKTQSGFVGIIPGGLGYKLGADSHGRAFFIFDPKNAKIIRKIDMPGMGISPFGYVTRGDTTVEFFAGDSEGNVLFCDMSEEPAAWNLKNIFRLRSSSGGPIAVTKAVKVGKTKSGARWLFGGTSDLMVPDFSDSRVLHNEEQYIFALNLSQVADKTPVATVSDLIELKYLKSERDVTPAYGENGPQTDVPANSYGWALKLRPRLPHPTHPTDPEYVTTSPYLYHGVLYVSTFIPRTRKSENVEQCPELGDAKLYALDPITGQGKWKDGSSAKLLANIKISGISASKGILHIALKQLKGNALDGLKDDEELRHARRINDQVIQIREVGEGDEGFPPDLEPYVPHLQYWKEAF